MLSHYNNSTVCSRLRLYHVECLSVLSFCVRLEAGVVCQAGNNSQRRRDMLRCLSACTFVCEVNTIEVSLFWIASFKFQRFINAIKNKKKTNKQTDKWMSSCSKFQVFYEYFVGVFCVRTQTLNVELKIQIRKKKKRSYQNTRFKSANSVYMFILPAFVCTGARKRTGKKRQIIYSCYFILWGWALEKQRNKRVRIRNR